MKRLLATFVVAASTAGALAAGSSAMPDPCCDDPGPAPRGYGLAALGAPTTSPAPFTTSAYGAPAAITTASTPSSTSPAPLATALERHAPTTAKSKARVQWNSRSRYAKRIADAADSAGSYAEFSSWVQGHPAA